jgi:hypothetical protein
MVSVVVKVVVQVVAYGVSSCSGSNEGAKAGEGGCAQLLPGVKGVVSARHLTCTQNTAWLSVHKSDVQPLAVNWYNLIAVQ